MCDADGVARFKQFERSFRIDAEDGVLNVGIGRGIGAAGDEFVLGFDVLGRSAADRRAFGDDHVAWLGHGEVRLSGNDHAEALQVGEGLELRVAMMIKREFAEVHRASLRRNRPEHISQILEPELGGVFKILELCFNLEIGLLAFDLRFAGGALHQVAAVKVDSGRSTLQAIMHCFDGAQHRGRRSCIGSARRGGDRRRGDRLRGRVRRRSWSLRGRERRGGRKDNSQTQFFHSVSRSGGDRDFQSSIWCGITV